MAIYCWRVCEPVNQPRFLYELGQAEQLDTKRRLAHASKLNALAGVAVVRLLFLPFLFRFRPLEAIAT